MTSDARPGTGSGQRLLLVDDDSQLLVTLSRGLTLRGFQVETCDSAGAAMPYLQEEWPEVVILDVAMPGMNGVTFCNMIRDRFTTPILMLTARDSIQDRVAGLDAGADDYLVKPFALDELIARIHALLRRAQGRLTAKTLTFGDLTLERDRWRVTRGDRVLNLTSTEFLLLEALMAQPRTLCTREFLLSKVWGPNDAGSSNIVDRHISNLRRKLEEAGASSLIHTVRGIGYQLQAPA